MKKMPLRDVSAALATAATSTTEEPVEDVKVKPTVETTAPVVNNVVEQEEEEVGDNAPEGLTLLKVGALVPYSNREKIKSRRSITKALERVDSGTIKIGTDIPKYIADQLSYMAKQSGMSQKDYILKLTLEDMYKRGVFEEPKADS